MFMLSFSEMAVHFLSAEANVEKAGAFLFQRG